MNEVVHEVASTVTEKLGVAGTQIGGGMAIFGGLTLNDTLAVAGFLLALVSVVVQIWYKERHYRLAKSRQVSSFPYDSEKDELDG